MVVKLPFSLWAYGYNDALFQRFIVETGFEFERFHDQTVDHLGC